MEITIWCSQLPKIYIATSASKRRICHFLKWQIRPFTTKVIIYCRAKSKGSSAYFTSKQIPPFGFAEQYRLHPWVRECLTRPEGQPERKRDWTTGFWPMVTTWPPATASFPLPWTRHPQMHYDWLQVPWKECNSEANVELVDDPSEL